MDFEKEMFKYKEQGFNENQIYQIYQGLIAGIDTTVYAKLDYEDYKMEIIRWGLEKEINVQLYMNPALGFQEMYDIYWYLRKRKKLGLD